MMNDRNLFNMIPSEIQSSIYTYLSPKDLYEKCCLVDKHQQKLALLTLFSYESQEASLYQKALLKNWIKCPQKLLKSPSDFLTNLTHSLKKHLKNPYLELDSKFNLLVILGQLKGEALALDIEVFNDLYKQLENPNNGGYYHTKNGFNKVEDLLAKLVPILTPQMLTQLFTFINKNLASKNCKKFSSALALLSQLSNQLPTTASSLPTSSSSKAKPSIFSYHLFSKKISVEAMIKESLGILVDEKHKAYSPDTFHIWGMLASYLDQIRYLKIIKQIVYLDGRDSTINQAALSCFKKLVPYLSTVTIESMLELIATNVKIANNFSKKHELICALPVQKISSICLEKIAQVISLPLEKGDVSNALLQILQQWLPLLPRNIADNILNILFHQLETNSTLSWQLKSEPSLMINIIFQLSELQSSKPDLLINDKLIIALQWLSKYLPSMSSAKRINLIQITAAKLESPVDNCAAIGFLHAIAFAPCLNQQQIYHLAADYFQPQTAIDHDVKYLERLSQKMLSFLSGNNQLQEDLVTVLVCSLLNYLPPSYIEAFKTHLMKHQQELISFLRENIITVEKEQYRNKQSYINSLNLLIAFVPYLSDSLLYSFIIIFIGQTNLINSKFINSGQKKLINNLSARLIHAQSSTRENLFVMIKTELSKNKLDGKIFYALANFISCFSQNQLLEFAMLSLDKLENDNILLRYAALGFFTALRPQLNTPKYAIILQDIGNRLNDKNYIPSIEMLMFLDSSRLFLPKELLSRLIEKTLPLLLQVTTEANCAILTRCLSNFMQYNFNPIHYKELIQFLGPKCAKEKFNVYPLINIFLSHENIQGILLELSKLTNLNPLESIFIRVFIGNLTMSVVDNVQSKCHTLPCTQSSIS